MGFYEPDDGIVTIDGIPLFEHDIISFRQRIGFVPQESILLIQQFVTIFFGAGMMQMRMTL